MASTVVALAALAAHLAAASPVPPRAAEDLTLVPTPTPTWFFPGGPSITISVPSSYPTGGGLIPDPVAPGASLDPGPVEPGAPIVADPVADSPIEGDGDDCDDCDDGDDGDDDGDDGDSNVDSPVLGDGSSTFHVGRAVDHAADAADANSADSGDHFPPPTFVFGTPSEPTIVVGPYFPGGGLDPDPTVPGGSLDPDPFFGGGSTFRPGRRDEGDEAAKRADVENVENVENAGNVADADHFPTPTFILGTPSEPTIVVGPYFPGGGLDPDPTFPGGGFDPDPFFGGGSTFRPGRRSEDDRNVRRAEAAEVQAADGASPDHLPPPTFVFGTPAAPSIVVDPYMAGGDLDPEDPSFSGGGLDPDPILGGSSTFRPGRRAEDDKEAKRAASAEAESPADVDRLPPPTFVLGTPAAPTIVVGPYMSGGDLAPDPVFSGGGLGPDPIVGGGSFQPGRRDNLPQATPPGGGGSGGGGGGGGAYSPPGPSQTFGTPVQPTVEPLPYNPGGPMIPGGVPSRRAAAAAAAAAEAVSDGLEAREPRNAPADDCTYTMSAERVANPCAWNGVDTVYRGAEVTVTRTVDCHGCARVHVEAHAYGCNNHSIRTVTTVATPHTRYVTACAT